MSIFLKLAFWGFVAIVVVLGVSCFHLIPSGFAKTPPHRSDSEPGVTKETMENAVSPKQKKFSRRESDPKRSIAEARDGVFDVKRVVDGDTLMIDGSKLYGHFRLRLTGIDTPETVKEDTPVQPFGPEATAYTKRRIAENGDRVYLEFGTEKADQYGRALAFVWLDNRTSLLNEELVREGLAKVLVWYEYSPEIKKRLKDAQDDAKRNGRGMWASKKQ